jgi:SAM-dependent methyltransferase
MLVSGDSNGRPIDRRLKPRFYDHDWHHLSTLRRALTQALERQGLPRPGQRVVDLGCGDRPYEPLFPGCTYVGCDLNGSADVHIQPGTPVPLPDGFADGVLSFQVLEHVWDLDWYLGECRRLLRPGGWLLLSTHGNWLYHPHPADYRRWTAQGLRAELTTRGFVVRELAAAVGPLAWTTQFRLLGYREALRRLPLLGPVALAPLTCLMNLRMVLEDAITPASIRDTNASVYVTLSFTADTARR